MRVMRRFTLPDLVATAEIGRRNASEYCRGLLNAGLIRVDTPRRSGTKSGNVIYLLIKDIGPKAPRLRRNGTTYDPNQHTTQTGGLQNDRWHK